MVLLWFYLSAFAILVGAILDASIDRLAAEGDHAGGKGSGRRQDSTRSTPSPRAAIPPR